LKHYTPTKIFSQFYPVMAKNVATPSLRGAKRRGNPRVKQPFRFHHT